MSAGDLDSLHNCGFEQFFCHSRILYKLKISCTVWLISVKFWSQGKSTRLSFIKIKVVKVWRGDETNIAITLVSKISKSRRALAAVYCSKFKSYH
jgi:hypothetical protein